MKPFALSDLPENMQAEDMRKLHPHYVNGFHSYQPHNNPSLTGGGPRPIVQKWKAPDKGATDNPPGKAKVDEEGRPFYRITITLRTSDNRDRDADGAYSTLLDTYLFAIGGLLGVDRRTLRTLAKGEERRRRGGHNH
jgi:hypothetical protein